MLWLVRDVLPLALRMLACSYRKTCIVALHVTHQAPRRITTDHVAGMVDRTVAGAYQLDPLMQLECAASDS